MTQRKTAAVVGMGWMGSLHAAAYRAHPDVELVGVVETDPERVAQLEREQGPRAVGTLDELLDEVDLVSVCTPDHQHVDVAVHALAAGKRTLVEKPLAMDPGEARRILDARRHPDDLMVGQILRFDPRVVRARELVVSGALGELWHVEVWRNTTRGVAAVPSERTSVGWFLGIHDADLLLHLTGLSVRSVTAEGRRLFSAHLDVVHALVDLEGGVVGRMENAWTLPDTRASRAHAGVRLSGSEACIEVDLSHHGLLISDQRGTVERDVVNWPSDAGQGPSNIQREVDAFVLAAQKNGPAPVSGEAGLRAVELVARIHDAATSDRDQS
jgi:predicted dehydrogenase